MLKSDREFLIILTAADRTQYFNCLLLLAKYPDLYNYLQESSLGIWLKHTQLMDFTSYENLFCEHLFNSRNFKTIVEISFLRSLFFLHRFNILKA